MLRETVDGLLKTPNGGKKNKPGKKKVPDLIERKAKSHNRWPGRKNWEELATAFEAIAEACGAAANCSKNHDYLHIVLERPARSILLNSSLYVIADLIELASETEIGCGAIDRKVHLPVDEVSRRRKIVIELWEKRTGADYEDRSEYGKALADAWCHGFITSEERKELLVTYFRRQDSESEPNVFRSIDCKNVKEASRK